MKNSEQKKMIKMYGINTEYKLLEKVGKGTYGTVYKALNLKTNKFVALKKLESNDAKLQAEGFPITTLREIHILKQLNHPNIIRLEEIILSKPSLRNSFRGSTFLAFEYMDHDFTGLFKGKVRFSDPQIKCIIRQLLEGVHYLHSNKIMHRDIKSANILMNDDGQVKLADFGLGRRLRLNNQYTYKVVTLWYRAPQLLIGCRKYGPKVDTWSIGCVLAEFYIHEVLFRKQTQHNQIQRIFQLCGIPQQNGYTEQMLKSCLLYGQMKPKIPYTNTLYSHLKKVKPQMDQTTIEFICQLLNVNPNLRLSAEQALRHKYFDTKPLPCKAEQIQKMEYEYHQMFKDRSTKIDRKSNKQKIHRYSEKKANGGMDVHNDGVNGKSYRSSRSIQSQHSDYGKHEFEEKNEKVNKNENYYHKKKLHQKPNKQYEYRKNKEYDKYHKGRQYDKYEKDKNKQTIQINFKGKRDRKSSYSSDSSSKSHRRSREHRERRKYRRQSPISEVLFKKKKRGHHSYDQSSRSSSPYRSPRKNYYERRGDERRREQLDKYKYQKSSKKVKEKQGKYDKHDKHDKYDKYDKHSRYDSTKYDYQTVERYQRPSQFQRKKHEKPKGYEEKHRYYNEEYKHQRKESYYKQ